MLFSLNAEFQGTDNEIDTYLNVKIKKILKNNFTLLINKLKITSRFSNFVQSNHSEQSFCFATLTKATNCWWLY